MAPVSGDGVMLLLSSFLTASIRTSSRPLPPPPPVLTIALWLLLVLVASDFFFTLTGLSSSSPSRLTLDATLESAPMLVVLLVVAPVLAVLLMVGVDGWVLVPVVLLLVDMFGSVLVDELGVTAAMGMGVGLIIGQLLVIGISTFRNCNNAQKPQ